MKKQQILVILFLIVSTVTFSQVSYNTYSNGNLSYSLPKDWNPNKLLKRGSGISYGGTYFGLGESLQFSVIEMPSPPNKTVNSIKNTDFKGALKNIFNPKARFGQIQTKYINKVKTKYVEAIVTQKGKKVYSLNYVTVYKGKVMFIQGIILSKNVKKSTIIIQSIFNKLKFK